ncbi:hypothetical protein RQM47_16115 [Rubrivirga sp. S365]|uniref:hypothetical protein n=1 Tax=Rubrivirga sp. S365 TaxID=3076080 RepID=UPI0028C5E727|nr:hypothetical protein [Rubrivirga sp. S365]MDT7858174.1 hypothetical protein [Rubrivirga sp. S365]
MRNLLLSLGALSLGALSLGACDSAGLETGAPSAAAPASASLVSAGAGTGEAAERAALADLTEAFALAMGAPAVRNEVRRDLADSRFTVEHKLHLQDHLAAQAASGRGKLLAAMAEETGRSTDEVLALARSVRELEFYLPVDDHRARWRGGKDIVVASIVEDEDVPTAFDVEGQPVALRAYEVPVQTTLSIVPVETDFSAPLPASVVNTDDAGGAAIGTYALGGRGGMATTNLIVDPCEDPLTQLDPVACGGTGGGGTSSYPPGLYYTRADMDFVGEAGLKGSPEIEIIVFNVSNGREYPFRKNGRCSAGEYGSLAGYRRFDQNGESWSGNALALSQSELDVLELPSGDPNFADRGFAVAFWEDDYKQCELYTKMDLMYFLEQTAKGGALIGLGVLDGSVRGIPFIAWGVFNIGSTAWAALHSSDDFLGFAVARSSVMNPGHLGYSHVLYTIETGSQRNGAVNLIQRF